MKPNDPIYYQGMINDIFSSVGQAIGIHVLLLVIEHSLWKTQDKYDEACRITFSEEGVSLEGLKELDEETAKLIAHEFMMSIISTLGRLVGMQLANKLTEELQLTKGDNRQ